MLFVPPGSPVSSTCSKSVDRARTTISFDQPLHAALARFTLGISPAALSQAYTDWLQHLLFSPDKQLQLV